MAEENNTKLKESPSSTTSLPVANTSPSPEHVSGGPSDTPPIKDVGDFTREFFRESRKILYLAGPAIFMSLCQYTLGAITQVFTGHVGTIDLAAMSVHGSVTAGLSYGIMLGMSSAVETLCGQAYGAGQLDMLGVYLQRSWLILNTTALALSLLYIFAAPILRHLGQTEAISAAAGRFARWMIPQLFALAFNFPINSFLQAQSKVMVMALIPASALVLHVFFSWLLMLRLRWGLVGAAIVLDASWWFIVGAQLLYIFSGNCGRAWSGFSWKAFHNIWAFVRLSLASGVMLCLELWYYTALVLFAGHLKNAQVSVSALSISMNILGWTIMISLGFNIAVSVRVSNELGAGHPRKAKFALAVASTCSFTIALLLSLALLVSRHRYPSLFSNDTDVKSLVKQLTPILAICIIISNVQPVLSGVAVGAGWQATVAKVNIVCYYVFGIPIGLIFGYKLKWGVRGIWYGMLMGCVVQSCVLIWMIFKTNWNREASAAGERIKKWGGESDPKEKELEDLEH